MFEVQASKGSAGAEIFSSAAAGYRKSECGMAQRVEVSSTVGGWVYLFSGLQDIHGQNQGCGIAWRMEICPSESRFRPMSLLCATVPERATVANSYYSVKMSAGDLDLVPRDDRGFSTVYGQRLRISDGSHLADAIRSIQYRDERRLESCR